MRKEPTGHGKTHVIRFATEVFIVGLIYYLLTTFTNADPPIWTIAILLVVTDNLVEWLRSKSRQTNVPKCSTCGR